MSFSLRTEYKASNNDFSGPLQHADSKAAIFNFFQFWGPYDHQGPGGWLRFDVGPLPIEPFFWGGGWSV